MQKTSLNLRLHSLIGNSSSRSKEQEARLRRTQLCQINFEVEFAHVKDGKKRGQTKKIGHFIPQFYIQLLYRPFFGT